MADVPHTGPNVGAPQRDSVWSRWACFGLAAACVRAFHGVGQFHGGYQIPARGVSSLPEAELTFYVYYLLWGSLAIAFGSAFLVSSGIAAWLLTRVRGLLSNPPVLVAGSALATLIGAIVLRSAVLLDQPITDDESTYDFIMETLLAGRFTNVPLIDPEFLRNQFVVIKQGAWHGKYTIGHPLVLALGELLGLSSLVVPLLSAASLCLTYAIGTQLFGQATAALGAMLLAFSPQFVWTSATRLSQVTSCCFTLLAMWATLRLFESRQLRFATLAGAGWGASLLARPMPTLFFIATAAVAQLVEARRRRDGLGAVLREGALLALGPCAALLLMGLTNYAQSGHPLSSGYQEYHHSAGRSPFTDFDMRVAGSVAGALLRQNFWQLGWPCAAMLALLARPRRASLLFWGLIAASYAYRLAVPKTVVSSTGPVYMFEIVPLLSLGIADGTRAATALLTRLEVRRPREWLAATFTAGAVVGLSCFVPVQLGALMRSADARQSTADKLATLGPGKVLVFSNSFVAPELAMTWAYYPPNPSPDLDDQILHLRLPQQPDGLERAWKLWRERFPDRKAVVYVPLASRRPVLMPLDPQGPPDPAAFLAAVRPPETNAQR